MAKYTHEELQQIADTCKTYTDFGAALGYKGAPDSQCDSGKRVIELCNLDFAPNTRKAKEIDPRSYDKDYVQNIVNESHTFTDVARKLGYKSAGKIPGLLSKLGIDYTHFDPFFYHRGTRHTLDELKENTTLRASVLRTLLSQMGIVSCQQCGCGSEWNGAPITLEVHHKNGIHSDNRIENLVLLCPKCHAHTENRGVHKRSNLSAFRREILDNRERACEECHLSQWNGTVIPLEFHHKDGNNQHDTMARRNKVSRYLDKEIPLYGYLFETVKEEEYFDVIEKYEVISYSLQKERTIPPKIERPLK